MLRVESFASEARVESSDRLLLAGIPLQSAPDRSLRSTIRGIVKFESLKDY
jgi:hypothetical protein